MFPLVLGLGGLAILLALGIWQLQRLQWKEAVLADIDARIMAVPVDVPQAPDLVADRFLPVTVTGDLTGQELHVLTSGDGPGYRVIAVLETADRRIMADLGFVPLADKALPRAASAVTITGNLHWPAEVDGWTPAPDPANIWFARDVPTMAEALGTEPLLVIVREMSGADLGVTPLPIDSSTIKNDHREYAITWFLLAFVWVIMTGLLMLRTARAPRKE